MSDLATRIRLLSAATATGAGTTYGLSPPRFISSAQVIITGAPSAVVGTIQGSLDNGTTWYTLATFDTGAGLVTGDIVAVTQLLVTAVRANLGTLTAGTVPTVTVIAALSDQSSAAAAGGGGGSDAAILGTTADPAVVDPTIVTSAATLKALTAGQLTELVAILAAQNTTNSLLSSGSVEVAFDPSALTTTTSVLTIPDAIGHAQNTIVASHGTAGSIVVPSFTATRSGVAPGSGYFRKGVLRTNKTTTMGTASFQIDVWDLAPTFTNGDGAAYAVATGATHFLGSFTTNLMTQAADGAYCEFVPKIGSEIAYALSATTLLYWTLKVIDSTGFTSGTSQTFTLVPQLTLN